MPIADTTADRGDSDHEIKHFRHLNGKEALASVEVSRGGYVEHGALDLYGNADNVKVSATDVASHQSCPRYLALKIRPDVRSRVWQRSFGSEDTFVLGVVNQLVQAALRDRLGDQPETLSSWLRDQLDHLSVHRLLRPYVTTAVENVLEVHWEIEDQLGELKLITNDPWIGRPPRVLCVWGPLYGTATGTREVRRYRLGSAHQAPEPNDVLWAHVAARVAASARGPVPASRVRVVEVGAGSASLSVLFDDEPAAAVEAFETSTELAAQL